MKNYARLHEELDFLRMHPKAHQQNIWLYPADLQELGDAAVAECGTVGCLAGWAVIHEYDLVVEEIWNVGHYDGYRYVKRLTGEIYDMDKIESDARKIFGLNLQEVTFLFHGDNTIDDMEHMVKNWENEAEVKTVSD